MSESPRQTPIVLSWQSREEFIAGLPQRTKNAVERLSAKPVAPLRILAVRATGDTAIQFGEIEMVLKEKWLNTTQILEAAIKQLYIAMKKQGLI